MAWLGYIINGGTPLSLPSDPEVYLDRQVVVIPLTVVFLQLHTQSGTLQN